MAVRLLSLSLSLSRSLSLSLSATYDVVLRLAASAVTVFSITFLASAGSTTWCLSESCLYGLTNGTLVTRSLSTSNLSLCFRGVSWLAHRLRSWAGYSSVM